MTRRFVLVLSVLALPVLAVATSSSKTRVPAKTARVVQWRPAARLKGIVDLAIRSDGTPIVAGAKGLSRLLPNTTFKTYAPSYKSPGGEPYIAASTGERVRAAHCSFPAGSLYALSFAPPGVIVVDSHGHVWRFVLLPAGFENGIAFDTTGRFGGRLLVTEAIGGKTTLFAIDCRRNVSVVTRTAPRLEGGIAVAPNGFGAFAGDLIVPDEIGGTLYAIAPTGRTRTVVASGIAAGQDVGVESEGFVPDGNAGALVADRLTPGNPHPGDDYLLRMAPSALKAAGVKSGDLLVASEGGAVTIVVRCHAVCSARHVAGGPTIAHVEGHIVFVPS